MSSTRGLRSFQSNVTRSASKSSFAARSTVNFHSKQSCEDNPASRAKAAKKRSRSQGSPVNLKTGPGLSRASSVARLSTRVRSPSISRIPSEKNDNSLVASSPAVRGRKPGRKKLNPSSDPRTSNVKVETVPTMSFHNTPSNELNNSEALPQIPKKRGRKKKVIDTPPVSDAVKSEEPNRTVKDSVKVRDDIDASVPLFRKRGRKSQSAKTVDETLVVASTSRTADETSAQNTDLEQTLSGSVSAFEVEKTPIKADTKKLSPTKTVSQSNIDLSTKLVAAVDQPNLEKAETSSTLESKTAQNCTNTSTDMYLNQVPQNGTTSISNIPKNEYDQTQTADELRTGNILTCQVRKEKSLQRELSNLSFSNPGKLFADTEHPLCDTDNFSTKGKALRRHSDVKYFKQSKHHSNPFVSPKQSISSIERMKVWKVKQASLKRKASSTSDKDGPSEIKKMNVESAIDCEDFSTLIDRNKTENSSSDSLLNNNETVLIAKRKRGRPPKSSYLKRPPGSNAANQTSADQNVKASTESVVQSSSEMTVQPSAEPVVQASTADPVVQPSTDCDLQPEAKSVVIPENLPVVKKKKRKRRSYRGCLDASFKAKKYVKKPKPSTGEAKSLFDQNASVTESNTNDHSQSRIQFLESNIVTTCEAGVDSESALLAGFVVEDIQPENLQNNDCQDTVFEKDFDNNELVLTIQTDYIQINDSQDDELELSGHSTESSLHEEHSYAKNSPTISPDMPDRSEYCSRLSKTDKSCKPITQGNNVFDLNTDASSQNVENEFENNLVNKSTHEDSEKSDSSDFSNSETQTLDTGQSVLEEGQGQIENQLKDGLNNSVDDINRDFETDVKDMSSTLLGSNSKLQEKSNVSIQSNARKNSDKLPIDWETVRSISASEVQGGEKLSQAKIKIIDLQDSVGNTVKDINDGKNVEYLESADADNEILSSDKDMCVQDLIEASKVDDKDTSNAHYCAQNESLPSKFDKDCEESLMILSRTDNREILSSHLSPEKHNADKYEANLQESSPENLAVTIEASSSNAISKTEEPLKDEILSATDSNHPPTAPLSILIDLPDPHGPPPQLTPQLTPQSEISLSPLAGNSYMISPPILQAQICSPFGVSTCELNKPTATSITVNNVEDSLDSNHILSESLMTRDTSVHFENKEQLLLSDMSICSIANNDQTLPSTASVSPNVNSQSLPQPSTPLTSPVVFKKPRGRPKKKTKIGSLKSALQVPKVKKPKKKLSSLESAPLKTVTRTFALRPQISRSPLENIALRFGLQPGYLSVKKKPKSSDIVSDAPSEHKHSSTSELLYQCKPCSVVLTDFVKQLDLTDISSSEEEDSFDSDSETTTLESEMKQSIINVQGSKEQSLSSPPRVMRSPKSPQSARKSVSYPSSYPVKNLFHSYSQEADVLASEILQLFANYKCKYCNFCSESVQLIEEHVHVHQNYFSTFPIGCSLCGRRYTNRETFESHHSRLHPLESRKFVEFNSMDEKEHYQIVLRDGSVIDLKIPDVTVTDELNSAFMSSGTKLMTQVQEPDFHLQQPVPLAYESESISNVFDKREKVGNSTKDDEPLHTTRSAPKEKTSQSVSVDKTINTVMEHLLDKIDYNLSQESAQKDKAKHNKMHQNIASKNNSLGDNASIEDKLEVSKESCDDNEGIKGRVEPTTATKSVDSIAVNPLVEKLRKIVKSVPQAISKPKTAITTTAAVDSNVSSVFLHTEQGGTRKSSVLNSPTNAPVIVSVVISGNVEVSKPEVSAKPNDTAVTNSTSKFICTYCMYGSDDRSRMVEHVTLMHSDEAQFTCCICDEAFSSKMSVIQQHIKTNHPDQDVTKSCKPLPSFYAVDELLEHDSLRSKTSDNIFEMFGSSSDSSAKIMGENEPLRQHFRKARDVMSYREKARRQAEADSTTSCSGEETESNGCSDVASSRLLTDDNVSKKQGHEDAALESISLKSIPISADVDNFLEPEPELSTDDGVSSSYKDTCKTSNSTDSVEETVETFNMAEDETSATPVEGQTVLDRDSVNTDDTDCSSLLKIVSVVSLREEPGETFETTAEESSTGNSGAISLEAAKSAVSALFKKSSEKEVYTDSNCKLCDKSFSSMFLLLTHLRVIHRQMCYFSCPLCKLCLGQQKHAVKEHMIAEHDSSNISMEVHVLPEENATAESKNVFEGIKCQHCSVYLPSAGAMLKHLKNSHGENCLLVCPYCKKGISKIEEDTYAHIRSEHKNYDPFVPLLLVSNNSSPVEKSDSRSSFTIPKSSFEMFKKTVNSSMFQHRKSNTGESSLGKSREPFDSKAVSPNFVEDLEGECPIVTKDNESLMSPLAMLTQSTSTILNRAHSEAVGSKPLRQSPEPSQMSGRTLSTVFNIQQRPNSQLTKRSLPVHIAPRPSISDLSLTTCPRLVNTPTDSSSSHLVSSQPLGLGNDTKNKPRHVVPRGIKHVEKRPFNDNRPPSQLGVLSKGGQQSNSHERVSTPSGLSCIPALKPAIAKATTVTIPVLKIPSVIPSSSPRLSESRNRQSSTMAQKQSTDVDDAPLDLSKTSQKIPELVEDDLDPEAFSVFNLAPTKVELSPSQPLNLSTSSPNPLSWDGSTPPVGYPPNYVSYPLMERPRTPHSVSPIIQHHNFPRFQPMPVTRHLNPRFVSIRPRMPSAAVGTPPSNQNDRSVDNRMLHVGRTWTPPYQQRPQAQFVYPKHATPPRVIGPNHQPILKKLYCPNCNFVTLAESSMKAHITKVHKARYRCPYCPQLVPLPRQDVYLHISQAHPGQRVMYFNL